MINNIVLVGRMTKDAELRYTPSNQAVATFSLAVNRNFKNQSGEREADFINCVIWRQQAENLANWAKKGALVGITGRILAYEIQDFTEGLYHIVNVEAEDAVALNEFDRLSKINGDILRHMIVKVD
ncbi:30S ribosomal protein S6 [Streptococcus agalactiae]|uniref:30S ribosomal protein S6 n=1 Tax=Streptococcus agalactiae TaxID=1311 RepID=UPI00376F3943